MIRRPRALLLLSLLATLPASAPALAPPAGTAIREAYGRTARTLVDLIARDDQDGIQALLTPGLRETVGKDRMAQLCRGRARTHGKPLGVGEPRADGVLVVFPVRCEQGRWELKIGLNLDGAVATLYLNEPADGGRSSADASGEIAPNRIRQDAVKAATALIELMNKDDQAGIQALFTPALREALPRSKMADLSREKIRLRGEFTRLGAPAINRYAAVFTAFTERGDWQIKLVLDRAGAVDTLQIYDVDPTLAVPERNATPLRLPFRDEWVVQWGGDTEEVNYHIGTGSRPQRRAIDFSVRGPSGKHFSGAGRQNADYYAYGKDVLAVADGVAVIVIDGVPENRPGVTSRLSATGNVVMIRHAPGEFSAVYHLIPGSIKVGVGQAVKAGQVIGRCGNSGNSSGPHLHFQVTNSDDYEVASGIAPHFRGVQVTRDGPAAVVDDYVPARHDRVRSAPAGAAR